MNWPHLGYYQESGLYTTEVDVPTAYRVRTLEGRVHNARSLTGDVACEACRRSVNEALDQAESALERARLVARQAGHGCGHGG